MKEQMTIDDIAVLIEVKPATVRQYHSRGDMPPADDHVGRTPVWRSETVEQWLKDRPGQGWRAEKRRADAT